MTQAEAIKAIIQTVAPTTAVIFIGNTPPRLIGTLPHWPEDMNRAKPVVDSMLFNHGLSATYLSRAACGGLNFVAAHGCDRAEASPERVVEFCIKELEWMMRGLPAHECVVVQRGVDRLRQESEKIILRASGARV